MEPRRTWIEPSPAGAAAATAAACGLPLPVALALWNRGFRHADAVRRFLEPTLDQLLDPDRMAGMGVAADRLARAVRDGEHVVVNGDYDADGVTGTALLVDVLRGWGGRIDFFIPDRERDGYGITPRLVERSGAVGVGVLVSVDCGSSEHATIARARDLGIDVVVVDHHEIPVPPAAAHAVLNPKRADCDYPFKGLAAVGVAYKLLQAVAARLGRGPVDGLDLVALGTLADAQPVVDENRALVALGLDCLNRTPRPGIRALRELAGLGDAVRSREVGFRLVPRLNAVGRVARGKLAVDLLLAAGAAEAATLAAAMEAQNRIRRGLADAVTQAALERAARAARDGQVAALVLADPGWHPGVVGIAAARLVDCFGVPAAVIGAQNGIGRGSARSASGVDVRAALAAAGDLLEKFGGHREAAGFTVALDRVAAFAARFTAAVREQQVDRQGAPPGSLCLDAALVATDIDTALVDALERLEPFGSGHQEPLFLLRDVEVGLRTRTVGDGHLKLELLGGSRDRALDGIAFGGLPPHRPADLVGRRVDVAAYVRRQDPRWGDGAQLVVADLRSARGST
jgi:single-stranded-DNA-specific exonuclease